MNAQPLSTPPLVEGAVCQAHPDRPALGACTRCGTFYCAADHRVVHGKPYCAACAVRPEVDYLETFRLQRWGRRDVWAWLIGLGAAFNLIAGLLVLVTAGTSMLVPALYTVMSGTVGACFWLGMPWARVAFLFVPVGSMVLGATLEGPTALARGVLGIVIAVLVFQDTRNKLFFKQQVSTEALQKAWHLYMNNTMARTGFLFGILGIFLPGLGLFAVLCSIIGLRRVDPHAHPPIGRKGQAIAGIILGALSMLAWVGFLVAMSLKS
jgi:hypothetical protein